MPRTASTRAVTTTANPVLARAGLDVGQVDLQQVAQHLYALMLRNIATDGFVFSDSTHTLVSRPGCVLAAPSYPANAPGVSQDYVFHWVRDAAITALELAAAGAGEPVQALVDYVTFARLCQDHATPTLGHACFTIDGQARPWSEQDDGPALQTTAILAAFPQLDDATRQVGREVVQRNVDHLLTCYREPTTNLWEEHVGYSFFARSVQLRCLQELTGNTCGVPVPAGTAEAVGWLQEALAAHWDGTRYVTLLGGASPGRADQPVVPGYDPNIDIVQAAVYGAVPCTDTRLLATAAQLVAQWADAASPVAYPINVGDRELGLGPLLGRYPADRYDGGSDSLGNHPWPLCTANLAQLYYEVAAEVGRTATLPLDEWSKPFFAQVGVDEGAAADAAAAALRDAGDRMLLAVLHHSDHLELSEQLDGTTGYEKSVRDLTWSYAAFLSAVRARNGRPVRG